MGNEICGKRQSLKRRGVTRFNYLEEHGHDPFFGN